MHPLLSFFYDEAKANPKRIILPESDDIRILEAAAIVMQEKLAEPVLLGQKETVSAFAEKNGLNLDKVEIIDHLNDRDFERYCHDYIESSKQKGKNMSEKVALKMVSKPINFGAIMLKNDRVYMMVAGANHTTSNVIKSAFFFIGPKAGYKTISSSFLMIKQGITMGENGAFLFADCGVNPEPGEEQLFDITISTMDTARDLLKTDPRVALLSFSSHGSASNSSVDKVRNVTNRLKAQFPDQIIDGELQFDAAVDQLVSQRKAPNSVIKGDANVFIFPDLNSGNIAYKIAERIGGCQAVGPLFQKLSKPMADLSRGCGVQDIVNTIVVTSGRTEN